MNYFSTTITQDNITIDTELNYINDINKIINNSQGIVYIRNKKHYLYKTEKGLVPVYLYQHDDGFMYPTLQYINGRYDIKTQKVLAFKGESLSPIGWVICDVSDFLNIFCEDNQLRFIRYSFRTCDDPKLSKPKELKGIRQAFSIDYIAKKCKCPIFINGNDVWVQHNDYFSPEMEVEDEDMGAPLVVLCKKYLSDDRKLKNFGYPDCWGSIVLRQQAWIKLENLMRRIKFNETVIMLKTQILRQQERREKFTENELQDDDMDRFWENVINKCVEYNSENQKVGDTN